jgi:hypothetical protein
MSSSSGYLSFIKFSYFCMRSPVAFCVFLEIAVLISDNVRRFLAKMFLKCALFSRNNNNRTPLVHPTVCACFYFITQNSVQKGSMKRKTSKRNNICYSQNLQQCALPVSMRSLSAIIRSYSKQHSSTIVSTVRPD